jgi:UDP-N-acetylglucosamine--N-acetylmuramyl-(pentapeptide) pyrophosphoryl-undecaprenol N-acetylglucosamine transferase
MRILLTGGVTGGHIFPAVATKRAITKILKTFFEKTKNTPAELSEVDFLFIGEGLKEIKDYLKKENIKVKQIISPKWRRYFSFQNIIDLFKVPLTFIQAAVYVWQFMPDVVFSKGGPGSLFVVIVAWLYRIPVVIHESDSFPGKTNKISASFSKKIAVSFEETKKFFPAKKTIFTGNPIREEIMLGSPERAKEIFNLSGGRKVILIMGGSQGAQQINLVFIDAIFKYIQNYEVIHVCGENNFKEINLLTKGLLKESQKKFYHLYPFLDEEKLKHAYAAADLIVSRAGSGAIFEIAAVKKPSIIIPLPGSASDHQSLNAKIFSDSGCSILIEKNNISPNMVYLNAKEILEKKIKSQEMIEACKKFAKLDAATKVAELIIKEA